MTEVTHLAGVLANDLRVFDLAPANRREVDPPISLPRVRPDRLGALGEDEAAEEARGARDGKERAGREFRDYLRE